MFVAVLAIMSRGCHSLSPTLIFPDQLSSVVPNIRGDCELRTQTQLDRESVSGYQLNVSVQNDVQSDSAMVAVTVLDVNDNKPKFVFPPNDEPTDGDQQNNTVVGSPSSSSASTVNSYFAVLPLETLANEKFFGVLVKF